MDTPDLKALMMGPPLLRLAAAESVTVGLVQARIGRISGASEFFQGGMTAYTPEAKVRHLGVDRGMALSNGAVSAEVAEQMSRGACVLFGADVSVATTGFAEPMAELGVAEPYAWWGLAFWSGGRWMLRNGKITCPGCGRGEAQERIADEAIAQLAAAVVEFRRNRTP